MRRALLVAAAVLGLARAAEAVEIANDGFTSGGSAVFQGGFAAGEIGAVRLELPGPGTWRVTKLRLLFGGDEADALVTFHVWDDAAHASAPGAALWTHTETLVGTDMFIQEIDSSVDLVVASGAVRVGIELTQSGFPAIARDDDGTVDAARNFIYSGGAWASSTSFFLTGDWIVRAEVTPWEVEEPADAGPGRADAGPGRPDAGGPECTLNSECVPGMFCNDSGFCARECRLNLDCRTGAVCMCVVEESGGGCAVGAGGGGAGALLLVLGLSLAVRRTSRGRGRRRTPRG